MTKPIPPLTVALLVLCIGFAAGPSLAVQQAEPATDVQVIGSFGFPPPPPLQPVEQPASEAPAPRPVSTGLLGPPPLRARCITRAEREAALGGTGCDCTCEEYARKPVSDTCDIACGGHYICWAPPPTDAEVRAEFEATLGDLPREVRAMIPPPDLDALRGGIAITRGLAWDEARLCPDAR